VAGNITEFNECKNAAPVRLGWIELDAQAGTSLKRRGERLTADISVRQPASSVKQAGRVIYDRQEKKGPGQLH